MTTATTSFQHTDATSGKVGTCTVATYLIIRLSQLGIEHLFNVAGSYCGGLLLALPQSQMIRGIFTTHELESGHAADAYSRLKGYGAVCGTYGVGMFSLLNAVAGAFVERCALIVINGGPTDHQVAEEIEHGVLFLHSTGRLRTDFDVYKNVTVAAEVIRTASEAPRQIDAALQACIIHNRPVYLEINQQLWNQECPFPVETLQRAVPKSHPGALREAADEAFCRLARAEWPVIWGGEEISRFRLNDSFQALVEAAGLPYTTTLPGKSILTEEHPQFIGVYDGRFAPAETRQIVGMSDCIVAIGTSICDFVGDIVAKDYDLMILAAANGVRIGHHIYNDISLADFVAALRERIISACFIPRHPVQKTAARRRTDRCASLRSADSASLFTFDSVFMRMESFLQDKIVIADTSLALFASADLILRERAAYLSQSTWMSIGYSVGAAVGASCASKKRVVAFVGDCGFREGPQALSTLSQYNLPAIICVISNRLLGIEQFLMDASYYQSADAKPDYFNVLPGWDYRSLALAFGMRSARVTTLDELQAALDEASQFTKEPFLMELVLGEKDLPRGVREVLQHPSPTHVQRDLEFPLLSRGVFSGR